jgi:hypothetical protein
MNAPELARLSLFLDGRLAADEARTLERELAERPELAAELAALREQDHALEAAFAPLRRAVEARADALAAAASALPATRLESAPEPHARARPWVWLAAGLAAGVLATGTLLRFGPAPTEPPRTPPSAPGIAFARLEHALGPVEHAPAPLAPLVTLATGAELRNGAVLRTPRDGKCTLLLADGSRLRLDGGTELVLAGPRRVMLARGRMHAEVRPAGERFRAEAGASVVEVLGTRLDLAQRIGAQGSEHAGRELTELAVLEGSALLCGTRVEAGTLATALDGRFVHAREVEDLLVVTSWVNELLAFEPDREQEFQARVDSLLASLGRTKMAHLLEWEIRSLGDHCALPLLRFVESEESRGESARRRDAARILADVATLQHLPGLAELLTDADPEVRVSAARGIQRLTGGIVAGSPDDLAGSGFAEHAAAWRAVLERR